MQTTAHPINAAEISSRLGTPSCLTRAAVITGPVIAPMLPPAAMAPNRRLALSLSNTSVMKLQNTLTTK